MGAKTNFIAYFDANPADILKTNPEPNHHEALKLANLVFHDYTVSKSQECSMDLFYTTDDDIYIGYYPGLCILVAQELSNDCPSAFTNSDFLRKTPYNNTIIHTMNSVTDWLSFAFWKKGKLRRSLCLSPDTNILEDFGDRLPFELPYWSGKYTFLDEQAQDEYPFIFSPLELGEEALLHFFGFQFEGAQDPGNIDTLNLKFLRIKRTIKKQWWKFW